MSIYSAKTGGPLTIAPDEAILIPNDIISGSGGGFWAGRRYTAQDDPYATAKTGYSNNEVKLEPPLSYAKPTPLPDLATNPLNPAPNALNSDEFTKIVNENAVNESTKEIFNLGNNKMSLFMVNIKDSAIKTVVAEAYRKLKEGKSLNAKEVGASLASFYFGSTVGQYVLGAGGDYLLASANEVYKNQLARIGGDLLVYWLLKYTVLSGEGKMLDMDDFIRIIVAEVGTSFFFPSSASA